MELYPTIGGFVFIFLFILAIKYPKKVPAFFLWGQPDLRNNDLLLRILALTGVIAGVMMVIFGITN